MAVITLTTQMAGAINYTATTASSSDWSSVANSTYFYDLTDKLVHYKDSTGAILEIYGSAGGLTYFTEAQNSSAPNATVKVDSLTAVSSTTDADFSIIPKGAGAFQLAIPDNTLTGGNKRGIYSVDLQLARASATQVASGTYSVSLGASNTASGSGSAAIGTSVTASGTNAIAIGSGTGTASGNQSIMLGYGNIANNTSAISIGYGNTASGTYSTVAGGLSNTASGSYSFIAGGYLNTATGGFSFAGGSGCTVTGANSFAFGYYTTATGSYSYAIGRQATAGFESYAFGWGVNASGQYSLALGAQTTASGTYSTAMGYASSTLGVSGRQSRGYANTVVADCQKSEFFLSKRTTDATFTTITVGGAVASTSNQVILSDNSSYRFKGTIIGKKSGATNVGAWDIDGLIVRGVGVATTSLVISNVSLVSNASAWGTPTLSADTTNGGLQIQVSGLAATNIQWTAIIDTTEVIYA